MDRIFGTYHVPKEWPAAYGIEAKLPESLIGQLVYPFTRAGTRSAGNPPRSIRDTRPPSVPSVSRSGRSSAASGRQRPTELR